MNTFQDVPVLLILNQFERASDGEAGRFGVIMADRKRPGRERRRGKVVKSFRESRGCRGAVNRLAGDEQIGRKGQRTIGSDVKGGRCGRERGQPAGDVRNRDEMRARVKR